MNEYTIQFAQIIVTAIVGLGTAWIALKTRAIDAQIIRQNKKLEVIETTGDQIHTLVNAPMQAALLLAMVTTKRLWELSKDPADEAIYLRAENDYQDHLKRQATVDEAAKSKAMLESRKVEIKAARDAL